MKYLLAAVGLVGMMAVANAEVPPPSAAPAPSSSAPAPAPAADTSPEKQALAKIQADSQALQSGDHSDDAAMKKAITSLYAEVTDFRTKYPNSTEIVSISMFWAQLGGVMMSQHLDGAPTEAQVAAVFDQLAANDKLPKEQQAEARLMQLSVTMRAAGSTPDDGAKWDAVEAKFAAFEKDYGAGFTAGGQEPVLPKLRAMELQLLATATDHTRFDALVKKFAASGNPELVELAKEVTDKAQQEADLKAKPLDLKYTSVDGKDVDLAKMRGKVVLVDFWATWCGPCVGEVPNVVAAYTKYHDKGFEIVGVSLDQDKDAMVAFTKSHGMTWPQFTDGKGWDNTISKGLGIQAIPAMWLVGKDGKVITQDAREDLAGQIEKALAAK